MHIIITDPNTKEISGTACVDRASGTCYILQADVEFLDTLAEAAKASGAPKIILVVPEDATDELEQLGWRRSPTDIVLTRGG